MVQNLVSDDTCHLKTLFTRNGVDYHVSMDADEVFGIEDAVFILPNHTMSVEFYMEKLAAHRPMIDKELHVGRCGFGSAVMKQTQCRCIERRHVPGQQYR